MGVITDRLVGAIRSVVRAMTAQYDYAANIRYTVAGRDGDLFKLNAVKSGPWPKSVTVPVMPGAGGYDTTPAAGSMVLVSFAENDPSLPFVTHYVGHGGTGFVPTLIEIGGPGRPAARVGDQVASFFPPAMPITGTLSGSPFAGFLTIATPAYGIIQTGSDIVKIGGS